MTTRSAVLKGATVAVLVVAVMVSGTSAYYARNGWIVPDQGRNFYRSFIELMTTVASADKRIGFVNLVGGAMLLAILFGAVAGRYAGRVTGSPTRRTLCISGVALLAYLGSAAWMAITLALLSSPMTVAWTLGVPFLGVYGLIGAIVLLPLTVLPLVGGAAVLERWTRPGNEAHILAVPAIGALLIGALSVSVSFGVFAAHLYSNATWTLTTAAGTTCSVRRGMSRRSVRDHCGRPTDFGTERTHFNWELPTAPTCLAAVDAYSKQLVLFNCREEVAGVELFAARGLKRTFKDDFDVGR